jgi:hypothetical protein
LFSGREYLRKGNASQPTANANLDLANNAPKVAKEINYHSFKGYIHSESGNYFIRLKKVNFTSQYAAEAYVANKILQILPTIKRVSQPTIDVSDTLSLLTTVDLNFSQERSSTGGIAHFATTNYIFSLISQKTGKALYQTSYKKTNQGLLAKGFSTQEEAALDVFEKSLNQFLNQFIIGNFPISANILQVTETDKKKTEARFVKISVGRNQGIYTGFEFIIPELNSDSNKEDLVVKEVFQDYSICKVVANEKKLLDLVSNGNIIKVKTKYRP